MKLKIIASGLYQSSLGILTEIAYSFAIILMGVGVIYLVRILQWFSSQR